MQTILDDFRLTVPSPIVNVATVRHLSPFRYPGGKTWLVPKVLSGLRSLAAKPLVFVDPFLGGGSVPLAALIEGCVERVVLCEIDPAVASVWKVIFSPDYRKLCSLILNFDISREKVLDVISREPRTALDRAFQTIVRNRTFRGGILANGASLVRIGENGRGVASRWYPETLVKRIQLLHGYTDRVSFIEGDGMEVLKRFAPDPTAFIFIDPPYTAGAGKRAGSRLYDHSDLDHEAIFSTLAGGRAQFMMTYDDDLDVLRMAKINGFILQHIAMKNTHHRCMNELLITRS
ncbi:DNA adenine methylase [Edaphobacter sp.]|uniref:DNA adenine methylase n=1 Tax=Edaphobacter sp. TaxID=1934404 RepID=UPI002DBF0FF8|nr:DNA adenine methylase [Edaphobacter sp.]HEU5342553.1 DNA adenine methylase [Edaphobacter sp.]